MANRPGTRTRSCAGALVLAGLLAACGLDLRGTGKLAASLDDGGSSATDASDGTNADGGVGVDGSTPGDGGADASAAAGWKKSITIDPTKVAGDLADFPVWIDLVDPDIAAHAASDGHDLYFTASDGTHLDYEIQRWDAPSKHLSAWVRLPNLLNAAPTVLDVRYGGASAAPAPSPAGVFSASFSAVWHLEDALTATAIAEATGTHAGTASGLAPAQQVAAKLGGGVAFNGGSAQITFTNPLTGNGPHTISLWVAQRATSSNDALVVVGNPACGQSRWLHAHYNGDTAAVGFYCNDWTTANVPLDSAGFTLIHWVYEGGANGVSRIYRDGAQVAGPYTQSGTAIDTQGTGGYLGNAPAGWGLNMGATATLDEVRIATVARSASWIATEYANQSSPSTFYAVGPEEPAP